MTSLSLEWLWPNPTAAEGMTVQFADADQLRRKVIDLDHEARTRGVAISATACNLLGDIYSIVVGLEAGSILTFDGRHGDPPYLVSVGDKIKDLTLVTFCSGGALSELPASHVIPFDVALDALLASLEAGKPSRQIEWYGG